MPASNQRRTSTRRAADVRIQNLADRLVIASVLLINQFAKRAPHHANPQSNQDARHQNCNQRVDPHQARHAHRYQRCNRANTGDCVRDQVPAIANEGRGSTPTPKFHQPRAKRAIADGGSADEKQPPFNALHAKIASQQSVHRFPNDARAGCTNERALH